MSVQGRDPQSDTLIWVDPDTGFDWIVSLRRSVPQAMILKPGVPPPRIYPKPQLWYICFKSPKNEAIVCRIQYSGDKTDTGTLPDQEVQAAWDQVLPQFRQRRLI